MAPTTNMTESSGDETVGPASTEECATKETTAMAKDKTPTKEFSRLILSENSDLYSEEDGKNSDMVDEAAFHSRIEQLDKRGKAFYKTKEFSNAAEAFGEALELIEQFQSSTSLDFTREFIALTSSRSAAYENQKSMDLALADCNAILEHDPYHKNARKRIMRITESTQYYFPALVEAYALNIMFATRKEWDVSDQPVPHSKIEELLDRQLPQVVERHVTGIRDQPRPFPPDHSITRMFQSYVEYDEWTEQAARDGTVETISDKKDMPRVLMLFARGKRHAFDKNYFLAKNDIEEALGMVKDDEEAQAKIPEDTYTKLLEWAGMMKHIGHDFDAALECYIKCNGLNPYNATVLVKEAKVYVDANQYENALALFNVALDVDPECVDALFHRANLRIKLQQRREALQEYERCISLCPSSRKTFKTTILLRLALALISADRTHSVKKVKKLLDQAEKLDPRHPDIYLYRGHLHYASGKVLKARKSFEKAIELDPGSPAAHVSAATAVLEMTPSRSQHLKAVELLEKAILIDPYHQPAYRQLLPLLLLLQPSVPMALHSIGICESGLECCFTPTESKYLCRMKLMISAQLGAAKKLKMNELPFFVLGRGHSSFFV